VSIIFSVLACTAPLPAPPAPRPSRELESIYNQVRMDGIFMLNKDDLHLEDRLGQGNFGSVQRGTYKSRRGPIPVAVKVLKTADMPHAEVNKIISIRNTAGNTLYTKNA
jgi:hypothetical protein